MTRLHLIALFMVGLSLSGFDKAAQAQVVSYDWFFDSVSDSTFQMPGDILVSTEPAPKVEMPDLTGTVELYEKIQISVPAPPSLPNIP